jgi:hypothetical protein
MQSPPGRSHENRESAFVVGSSDAMRSIRPVVHNHAGPNGKDSVVLLSRSNQRCRREPAEGLVGTFISRAGKRAPAKVTAAFHLKTITTRFGRVKLLFDNFWTARHVTLLYSADWGWSLRSGTRSEEAGGVRRCIDKIIVQAHGRTSGSAAWNGWFGDVRVTVRRWRSFGR